MILKLNIVFLVIVLCHGYPQQSFTVQKTQSNVAPFNTNLDQLAEPSEHQVTIINDKTADNIDEDSNSDTMLLEPDHSETTGSSIQTMFAPVIEPNVDSQRFYPLFSLYNTNNGNPPSGHSRPFVYNQEGAYSHRPYSARQNLNTFDNGYRGGSFDEDFDHTSGIKPIIRDSSTHSSGVLGSGNFGVIRGGTFYNENDDISEFAGSNHHLFNPYYQNGHGRPASYYVNPKPTKHEQFANFRDFADINTPSNSAYSQYVIVYANKNSTWHDTTDRLPTNFKPKNINERLEMLDNEDDLLVNLPESTTKVELKKKNKLSISKQKLSLLLPEKKPWGKKFNKKSKTNLGSSSITDQKSTDHLYEPLLALS